MKQLSFEDRELKLQELRRAENRIREACAKMSLEHFLRVVYGILKQHLTDTPEKQNKALHQVYKVLTKMCFDTWCKANKLNV